MSRLDLWGGLLVLLLDCEFWRGNEFIGCIRGELERHLETDLVLVNCQLSLQLLTLNIGCMNNVPAEAL